MNATKLKFGEFELDVAGYELSRCGRSIKMERIPMELLLLLVDRRGQLVTRDEMLERLWGEDVFLDVDNSINTAISKIRVALKDNPEDPAFIKTIPGKGYRFIAPLTALPEGKDASTQSAELDHSRDGLREETISRLGQLNPERMDGIGRTLSRFAAPVGDALPAAGAVVADGPPHQFDSKSLSNPGRWWLWPSIAGAMLAAALAGWSGRDLLRRIVSPSPSPVIRSLGVLPLTNLSGNLEEAYFADGMTEALISELAGISALKVTSRTSVMRYKDSKKPVKEIARELGVDAIVEGTMLRSDERVRITAQLIDARTDSHLLSRTYEREIRDILTLQSSVATAIADQIRIQVLPGERARLGAATIVNPAAYQAYLKGRYFWNKRTEDGLRKALEYFQQAVDQDPTYAPAYAGLADTYGPLTNWGWLAPREAMPKAKAAALKALDIDDRLAEAHVSLGMVTLAYDWDWPAAGKHFERALLLNPAYPAAHQWYSNYLMILGRSDEALAEAKRAVDLDPVSPDNAHHLAWLLIKVGRFDEVIRQERKTLEMDPGFPPAHAVLNVAYLAKGMYREALEEAEKLSAVSPGSAAALLSLALTHARAGERSQAFRVLGELRVLSKQRYVPADYFASIYLGLGDKDQAFAWLEKAFEERSGSLPWLKVSGTAALHCVPTRGSLACYAAWAHRTS